MDRGWSGEIRVGEGDGGGTGVGLYNEKKIFNQKTYEKM